MNKITLLKIALLCSFFSFAQNIDTTKYQKVTPGDTIKNYYNQNNDNNNDNNNSNNNNNYNNNSSNDSIPNYYPNNPNNTPPQRPIDSPARGNARNNPVRKPIPPESELMKKLYFGCNLALQFYSYGGYNVFYYDLSPNVGYKVTDKFSVGVQILYNNTIESAGGSSASYSIIGGGAFARFLVLPFLFLQVEYDVLTTPPNGPFGQQRGISDEKLLGAGFKRNLSEKISYYISLLYDVQPSANSPYYYNPLVYRVGIAYNW